MSEYYLLKKKSGLGIFTFDFILLFLFAWGDFGLNIILAFFAAIIASAILFALMMIPYFGRVVVCACGVAVTMSIYSFIDGITGWFTKLHTEHPVQWWVTVIIGGLFIIGAHAVACPSPTSKGTILGDDDIDI